MRTESPAMPAFELDADDLRHLAHLLPPSAAELARVVGPDAAAALMRELPGTQVLIPRRSDANPAGARRYAQLESIVGAAAMPALLAHYGGNALDIPLCVAAAVEKRNRWIRSRFDHLTSRKGGRLSRRQAVYELGLELASVRRGLTYRQIERAIEASDAEAGKPAPQEELFPLPEP
jgi:hypothetical protein